MESTRFQPGELEISVGARGLGLDIEHADIRDSAGELKSTYFNNRTIEEWLRRITHTVRIQVKEGSAGNRCGTACQVDHHVQSVTLLGRIGCPARIGDIPAEVRQGRCGPFPRAGGRSGRV